MIERDDFKRLAAYHDYEARTAHELKGKFEAREVFSVGGGRAADDEAWVKEMIVTYSKLEVEHTALRDSFRTKIKTFERAAPHRTVR